MRFGVLLTGEYKIGTPPRVQVGNLVEQAAVAASVGFSSVWLGEHFLTRPRPTMETVPLLGRLSAIDADIELGGVFVVPLHHPMVLAEQVRALDRLTAERFVFCAALGWRRDEFAAFGVPMSSRVARLEEGIAAVRALRAEERSDGPLPVLLAGSAPASVRRAARIGDGWLGSAHTELTTLEQLVRVLEDERRGHPGHRRPLLRHCVVTPGSADDSAAAVAAYYRTFTKWGLFKEVPGTGADDTLRTALAERVITGTAEDCRATVARYQDLGFDELILNVALPGLDQSSILASLRWIGDEIIATTKADTPARQPR